MTEPVGDPDGDEDQDPELAAMTLTRQARMAGEARIKEAAEIYAETARAIEKEMSERVQPLIDALADAVLPILSEGQERLDAASRTFHETTRVMRDDLEVRMRDLRMRHAKARQDRLAGMIQCPHCTSYRDGGDKCMRCPGIPADPKKPPRRPAHRVVS